MYKRVTEYSFRYAFESSIYKNNFSYEGLTALYEYLEDLEESIGEEIELDIVAIACDFTEYNTIEECLKEYNFKTEEELEEHCLTIIKCSNNHIIIENF